MPNSPKEPNKLRDGIEEICGSFTLNAELLVELFNSLLKQDRERLVEAVKEMPTVCGRCGMKGTNIYGECECSFKASKFIYKKEVIKLIEER